MRNSTPVKPFFTSLTFQHRKALELIREKTGKNLRDLVQEFIADGAVKYEIIAEPTNLFSWPDW